MNDSTKKLLQKMSEYIDRTAALDAPGAHALVNESREELEAMCYDQLTLITINGRAVRVAATPRLSYERICREAGLKPNRVYLIVFSLPSTSTGRHGTVVAGGSCPLVGGLEIHATDTSNA